VAPSLRVLLRVTDPRALGVDNDAGKIIALNKVEQG
jgi:hypothetical protein